MELTLKLLSGRNAGKEIPVSANKFLIGRADDCHLRPHSDLVSRHHCVLMVEEGFCAIRDFGSRNGTYVNEERIVGQKELHNGDKVKVGVLEFEVELSSRVGGKRKPKVKDIKDVAQRTAASQGGDNDDDISDWLSEGEVTETREDIHETRQIELPDSVQPPHETPSAANQPTRDTVFMKKSPTEETTASKPLKPPEPESKETKEGEKGAETAKRLFGKQAPGAKQNTANSRDAAADALKKFFGTRKP